VLMMIGINDRKPIREAARATPTPRIAKPAPQPSNAPTIPEKPGESSDDTGAVTAPDQAASGNAKTSEFRTDAWSDAYIRRIDETIAALKTSGVPVFWVGLPPLRGQKSADDIPFLNDLYRSRADKAGIIFIDVWDGFADEDGHYTQFGPDLEGQTRRLRTSDGVYFTKAGARKLAHYVEREVQRWLNARSAPVAVAVPQEPKVAAPASSGPTGVHARPLSGPIISLTSERRSESDELLGANVRQPTSEGMDAKVLVRGEAPPSPAGRADDFAWPRRDVAPFGSDPVVATTDLPMTPMVAERTDSPETTGVGQPTKVAAAPPAKPEAPRRRIARRSSTYADAQSTYRPDYRRPSAAFQPFGFQPLFGGGRW